MMMMILKGVVSGADPGFSLGGGAPVSCSTSTPINHIVFVFRRIPVVLENRRSSQGGGVHTPCTLPLDLPLGMLGAVSVKLNDKMSLGACALKVEWQFGGLPRISMSRDSCSMDFNYAVAPSWPTSR